MRRRLALVAAGSALAAGIAGCLDSMAPPDDQDDTASDDTTNDGNGRNGDRDDAGDDRSDADDRAVVEATPRVDEPPHRIDPPDRGSDDEWNEAYLGEHIDREPSLQFEAIDHVPVTDQFDQLGQDRAFRARLARDETELEDLLVDPTMVDSDGRVVVVVESGYGSSSIEQRWARIEDGSGELRLHGFYTAPRVQTDDVAPRHSVLAVEAPDEPIDLARVRLTIDEQRRVRFNSTEGVVSIER